MPIKKTSKHGKKLARARSLKKVKPLQVNAYVNIGGGITGPSNPVSSPDPMVTVNPSLLDKTIIS